MSESSPDLLREILEEIGSKGPISFARFMDLCLYHPSAGYYTRGLGGGGGRDYLTSSGIHGAFGRLVARQAEEMWRRTGRAAPFNFVEFGPGEGHFAADFLSEASRLGEFFGALRYRLVETSPALRERQEALLSPRPYPVSWTSEEELRTEAGIAGRGVTGCLFANEFLDALPVHRIVGGPHGVMELFVGARDGGLVEIAAPPSSDLLARFLEDGDIRPEEGQEVDLCLEAPAWMERAAGMLGRGYVVVIDYGHEARDLYHPGRRRGTLLAYHRHRASEEFLQRPGEQDLTAHVDFTALRRSAGKAGGRCLGLITQSRFLLALGVLDLLPDLDSGADREESASGLSLAARLREREALKDLFLPGRMGESFRVFVAAKGDVADDLTGLAEPWARPPAADADAVGRRVPGGP